MRLERSSWTSTNAPVSSYAEQIATIEKLKSELTLRQAAVTIIDALERSVLTIVGKYLHGLIDSKKTAHD